MYTFLHVNVRVYIVPCYNDEVMPDTSSWLCESIWQQISSDAYTIAKVVELYQTSVDIDMSKIQIRQPNYIRTVSSLIQYLIISTD